MSRQQGIPLPSPQLIQHASITELHPHYLKNIMQRLLEPEQAGLSFLERLPFAPGDTTAGTETELQAVVLGDRGEVDLPLVIEQSDYFANIAKRAASGDIRKGRLAFLERYLGSNRENVWENSWVRVPRHRLSVFAQSVFDTDLLADKRNPAAGKRSDAGRFFLKGPSGEELLRFPISYLLKLSLADLVGSQRLPARLDAASKRFMGHYLNDNTSPETFSFHVVPLNREGGMGRAIARETSKRFLFTQLLAQYANENFGLWESGQRALVHFAPSSHPPEGAERSHRRCLLPRAVHEPLPLRLGPRRGQVPLHAALPPGAFPQPAQCGGEAQGGGDHHQQPGGAPQRLQREPRQ